MRTGKPSRVLVVDDEPHLRELLVDALSGEGMQVHAASSGKEAIELAARQKPDLVVADLCLGDCTGLEVIDRLRALAGDIPAVVITGQADARALAEASRRRPVEMMNKPLDLDRLRATVKGELTRQGHFHRLQRRTARLRKLARGINIERKSIQSKLDTVCSDLTAAYRSLSSQMSLQQAVLGFQRELLEARNDDDVFKSLFRFFIHRSGGVFGIAMVCNEDAELKIAGRFGVPEPDNPRFCELLAKPMGGTVVATPRCQLIDAGEQADMFDPAIRRYLAGLSILLMPLMPTGGEIIGLVILYRKGEQPFTDADLAVAEMIGPSTAVVIRRND